MKKLALALTFLVALPLAVAAQVTKEDLKKLASAGISDDVILSYIRANGGVAKLSADDIIDLKQAGASEKVMSAALGNAPAAASTPAPAPAADTRQYVQERTYAAPSTTYVYDSTYYTPPVTYTSYVGGYYGGGYAPYYYPYYPRYYSSGYCAPRYYGYTGYNSGYCAPKYYGGSGYSTSRGYAGVSAYRR